MFEIQKCLKCALGIFKVNILIVLFTRAWECVYAPKDLAKWGRHLPFLLRSWSLRNEVVCTLRSRVTLIMKHDVDFNEGAPTSGFFMYYPSRHFCLQESPCVLIQMCDCRTLVETCPGSSLKAVCLFQAVSIMEITST